MIKSSQYKQSTINCCDEGRVLANTELGAFVRNLYLVVVELDIDIIAEESGKNIVWSYLET